MTESMKLNVIWYTILRMARSRGLVYHCNGVCHAEHF